MPAAFLPALQLSGNGKNVATASGASLHEAIPVDDSGDTPKFVQMINSGAFPVFFRPKPDATVDVDDTDGMRLPDLVPIIVNVSGAAFISHYGQSGIGSFTITPLGNQ